MKHLVLTLVLLAAFASPVLGAAFSIGIYEDAQATDCDISDPGGATVKTIYIVQMDPIGPAVGSAWTLTWDPGMTMVWIGDTSPWFKVGDSQSGVQLSYSTCQLGTFMIDAVTMTSLGTSAPCSYFRLGPHPIQGRVVVSCSFSYVPFDAGEAIVNANGGCACTVATEQTTWGMVKALYR